MNDRDLSEARRRYEAAREQADEVLLDAMEAAYKALVGVPFNDKLREQIAEALRYSPGP